MNFERFPAPIDTGMFILGEVAEGPKKLCYQLYVLPPKPTHIKRFASLRLSHVNNKVNGRQQLMHTLGRRRGAVRASSKKMPMGREQRLQFS